MTRRLCRSFVLLWAMLLLSFLLGCKQNTATTPSAPPPHTSALPQPTHIATHAEIGQPAPNFTLTTFDGKSMQLSDLKGKPVVVNFWASWCPHCAREVPLLQELYTHYHPQGLEMLGVGVDEPDNVQQKAKDWGLTFPVGVNPSAQQLYNVDGVPYTFLIDRRGNIVSAIRGEAPKDELSAAFQKIM